SFWVCMKSLKEIWMGVGKYSALSLTLLTTKPRRDERLPKETLPYRMPNRQTKLMKGLSYRTPLPVVSPSSRGFPKETLRYRMPTGQTKLMKDLLYRTHLPGFSPSSGGFWIFV